MALVGSGCEKAKHHLNPSPKRPKTLRNRKRKTGETLPTEPSKDKKKIASSTTNLQAAGKTCPKTSWAFKKPASSSKHPNVTFGSHYERDSKTRQKLSKRHLWNALLKEIAKRPNRLCRTKDFATKTLETSPLERTTERDRKTSEPALQNERLCHKNSRNVTFGTQYSIDTSRKRPKPEPKNSFTLPLESTPLGDQTSRRAPP